VPERRTQGQRRAEAEHRVLEATKHVIAELGVGAVTFATIGAQAGYSRGIVTHHFGSRQNLMQTLARSLQNLVPAPPTGAVGRQRLLAQVDLYLTTLRDNPRDARVFSMLWAEAITGDPDLRPIFTERDAEFRAVVAQLVRLGIEDGTISPALDADLTAMAIVGQLRGISLQLVLTDGSADYESLRQTITQILEAGLTGQPSARMPDRTRKRGLATAEPIEEDPR
jgi:AcrR family transcriptional regulator